LIPIRAGIISEIFPKWDANPNWQGSHGFRAHDFFTYAERIGKPDCVLPDFGLEVAAGRGRWW